MTLSAEIELYFWSFTCSMLIFFVIMATLIFKASGDKTFLYYALYCTVTLIYAVFKYQGNSLPGGWFKANLNTILFYVQFVFHMFYLHFGTRFLAYPQTFPRFMDFVRKYTLIFILVTTSVFALELLSLIPERALVVFFQFIFVPIHIMLAFVIIIKIYNKRQTAFYFYLIGSGLYLIFLLVAQVTSLQPNWREMLIQPMTYFYWGVILECIFIGYGIGIIIKRLYLKQQHTQLELNLANQHIQKKLIEELEFKKKETVFLKEQNEKQELISQMAALKHKVFHSQMHSHFVFNVLNSVKVFILENDTAKASHYLTKFSKFIRKVLDGSVQNTVSLKSELESIELYLSIEKMRFEGRFNYEITIPQHVNLEQYHIPSLILQPFVENALWHGIMPGTSRGYLCVSAEPSEFGIIVSITDNGIGYNAGISRKKNNGHTSHGLSLVKQRLKHHNHHNQQRIEVEILDLSEQNTGRGTLVQMFISKGNSGNAGTGGGGVQ